MLPFKNRLTKKKDFENVYKNGLFFGEGNIAAKFVKNGLKETRIGFAVGMKFSKRAVERNQMKRKMREFFRSQLGLLEKGLDIVVMARKKEGEKIMLGKLQKDAEKLLRKSSLIKEKQ